MLRRLPLGINNQGNAIGGTPYSLPLSVNRFLAVGTIRRGLDDASAHRVDGRAPTSGSKDTAMYCPRLMHQWFVYPTGSAYRSLSS